MSFSPLRVVLLATVLGGAARAQGIQLNAPLARGVVGEVVELRVVGDRVVYAADLTNSNSVQLFAASLANPGTVIDLGATISTGAPDFELTPDGAAVVFRRPYDEQGRAELYRVASDGSTPPIRLHGALTPGGSVERFRISPDGAWVAYHADQEQDMYFELYAAPLGGGEARKVSGGARVLEGFAFAADSQSLFYRERNGPVIDLCRGSVRGRQPRRLLTRNPAQSAVDDFQVSSDGRWVVYRGDTLTNNVVELFRVPSDGSGSPVRLSAALVPRGMIETFAISPDGKLVVYRADQEERRRFELYSVPMAGGPPIRLNLPLPSLGEVLEFQFTPDGAHVVYRASQEAADVPELYVVPATGSAPPQKLSHELAPTEGVDAFHVTSDGARVAYASASAGGTYSVPIDASEEPVRLSSSWYLGAFSPDGASMVSIEGDCVVARALDGSRETTLTHAPGPGAYLGAFLGITATEHVLFGKITFADFLWEHTDLYAVPLDGHEAARPVNPAFGPGPTVGDVRRFTLSPRGDRALYLASCVQGLENELFEVKLAGRSNAVRLSDASAEHVGRQFEFGSDGRWSAFVQDGRLYGARSGGSARPIELAADVVHMSIAPDGRSVVFLAGTDWVHHHLLRVPIDGSAAPIQLASSLLLEPEYQVSPDSLTVVYVAREAAGDTHALFSVPADGAGAPIRLHAPFAPGGRVAALRISPDGARVVYVADPEADGTTALFSVPRDASAPPVRLDEGRAPETSLQAFAISPAGDRVVYLEADGHYAFGWLQIGRLHVVPIAGGASPLPLSSSAPGSVFQFQFTPDGTRVVYLENAVYVAPFRLVPDVLSVPADGSQAPVQLNDAPAGQAAYPSGRLAGECDVSADGSQVAFFEQDHLVAVPVDGSSAPRTLAADLPIQSYVDRLELTPDGLSAVYVAGGLFQVPLDGSRAPRVLDELPTEGGNYHFPLRVTADGSRVVYQGDLELDDVVELFQSPLGRPLRGASPPTR